MRGLRYDGILASTALALILAAPTSAANAQWQPWPPRPPAHVTHAKPKVTMAANEIRSAAAMDSVRPQAPRKSSRTLIMASECAAPEVIDTCSAC